MTTPLFRPEAIEHHSGGDEHGDILRFDRRWPRRAYRLLLAAACAAFVFVSVFNVYEYTSAPAVLRVDGRRTITATVTGAVESVEAKPGQLVERGAVLARMRNAEEVAEAARATKEFELQLVRTLRDLNDVAAKQSLATLRAARDQARNVIESRTIRAEIAGHVTDVRVHPGQPVNAGEVLLAIVPKDSTQVSLVAMASADYRPMLRPGLSMRFALDGFKYEYTDLVISDVSSEAIGPSEVQRLLGSDRAGAVAIDTGAKVLVTARLPAATFTSEGRHYGYFDGLTGTADIRVRADPILFTLLPGLRKWLPRGPG